MGRFCRSCCLMQAICPCTCLGKHLPSHPAEHPSTPGILLNTPGILLNTPANLLSTPALPLGSCPGPPGPQCLHFARTSKGEPRMRSGSSMSVGSGIHCSSVLHHESFPQHTESGQIHQTEQDRKSQIKLDSNSRERF